MRGWAPHDASYQHVDAPPCSADGEARPAYGRGASKQAHGASAGGSYYAGVGEGRRLLHTDVPRWRAAYGRLSPHDRPLARYADKSAGGADGDTGY